MKDERRIEFTVYGLQLTVKEEKPQRTPRAQRIVTTDGTDYTDYG